MRVRFRLRACSRRGFGKDGFKDANDDIVPDADAISYALDISGVGVASGLSDTLSGDELAVQGRHALWTCGLDDGAAADPAGAIASRSRERHRPGDARPGPVGGARRSGRPDETAASARFCVASLITLTATITDGDLDTDTATLDIGDAFNFEDDGPSIDPTQATVPTLMTDDTNTPNDAVGFVCGPVHAELWQRRLPKDANDDNVRMLTRSAMRWACVGWALPAV